MNENGQSADVYTPTFRQRLIEILAKDPTKRTEEEFQLVKKLLETVEGFSRHRNPSLRKIFAIASLYRTTGKTIIMNNNSRQGDYMFVLLEGRPGSSGSCLCYIMDRSKMPGASVFLPGILISETPYLRNVKKQGK